MQTLPLNVTLTAAKANGLAAQCQPQSVVNEFAVRCAMPLALHTTASG
jgi:hypothetical protein